MLDPFPEVRWYLYDNLSGAVILKHPYRPGLKIRCPHCGEQLKVERYTASCCGEEFKTSFGEIHQRRAVGIHDRTSGRGWASLRPFVPSHGTSQV